MAPRPRPPQPAANAGILNHPRQKTIRKSRLPNTTPVSEVFLKACEEKDWKKISACLDLGVDINCTDSDNHSALYKSLQNWFLTGNKEISDFFIDHPDLDVDQLNREKILEKACGFGQEDHLRKLLELPGIDVNAGCPLRTAIVCRHVPAINILAENSAFDWNGPVGLRSSPIALALDYGRVDLVELLLSQPSLDLGRIGYLGRSVGHFAVEYSFVKKYQPDQLNVSVFPVKCVELLSKDLRVNWNVRNHDGKTPIMIALKNQEKEMVKILLKNPRVDRGDLMQTQEGNEILTEMLQEADKENRKLPSKVPDCPVCLSQFSPDSRVFQCSVGHFVCGNCNPRVQHCPTCRGEMLGRAHGFENFLQGLQNL